VAIVIKCLFPGGRAVNTVPC